MQLVLPSLPLLTAPLFHQATCDPVNNALQPRYTDQHNKLDNYITIFSDKHCTQQLYKIQIWTNWPYHIDKPLLSYRMDQALQTLMQIDFSTYNCAKHLGSAPLKTTVCQTLASEAKCFEYWDLVK